MHSYLYHYIQTQVIGHSPVTRNCTEHTSWRYRSKKWFTFSRSW